MSERTLSWWSCSNCGRVVEKKYQAFKNPTVNFCIGCYREWMKSHYIKTKKDFDKALQQFQVISTEFYDICIEELRKETAKKIDFPALRRKDPPLHELKLSTL